MKFIAARLLITDAAKSIHFWKDIMGFKLTFGDADMGYAYFETGTTGSTGIELFARDNFAKAIGETTPAPTPTGRQFVLDFQVDDARATYAQLIERGAVSVHPPTDRADWGNVCTAHIADPDGNIIEIYNQIAQPDASNA